MAEKENELQKIDREARKKNQQLANKVRKDTVEWYESELNEGRAISEYDRSDIPFNTSEWYQTTKNTTTTAIIKGVSVGLDGQYALASVQATSKYFLGLTIEGVSLSDRIRGSANNAKALTKDTINEHIKNKTNFKRLSDDLTRKNISKGDLPKYLTDLSDAAKTAAGDTRELNRLIKNANKRIEQLAQNGAPTTALKRAYSKVVKSVEKGDVKALNEALKVAINKKAAYNNDRISRSEIAKANNMAFNRRFRDHPLYEDGLIYIRHSLSSRHVIYDECNFYAEADTMGLGAGIFDEEHSPAIPIHANCLCNQSIVARDVDKRKHRYSEEKAEKWIKKQSGKRQEILRDRLKSNEKRNSRALPKDQVVPIEES